MDIFQTDEILEIPVSEIQALFKDLIQVYDTLNEVLKEPESCEAVSWPR